MSGLKMTQIISPVTPSRFSSASPVHIARQNVLIFNVAVINISTQPTGTLSVTHV